MNATEVRTEQTVRRRASPSWSLEVPASFAETFVAEGGYWHAFDEDHSISLTSIELTDARGRAVPARSILQRIPRSEGMPVDAMPPGLMGWAVATDAIQPARASRILTGMLATDGRVALTTITGDDAEWAIRVWLSIRFDGDVDGRRRRSK